MPPTTHSRSREKPDLMSMTWKPRLVKTPTPTMSATTIAVAVNHGTPAAAPLDVESGMIDSPPRTAALHGAAVENSTGVFNYFLRRLGNRRAVTHKVPASGRCLRGGKNLDGRKAYPSCGHTFFL